MLNIFSVFIGGGLGCVFRYLISLLMKSNSFPYGTFFVNIAGCFILGFAYILILKNPNIANSLKLAISVGFCGGLTTFSTFSLETFEMLKNGQHILFFAYSVGSLILGILAVYLGIISGKNFF